MAQWRWCVWHFPSWGFPLPPLCGDPGAKGEAGKGGEPGRGVACSCRLDRDRLTQPVAPSAALSDFSVAVLVSGH